MIKSSETFYLDIASFLEKNWMMGLTNLGVDKSFFITTEEESDCVLRREENGEISNHMRKLYLIQKNIEVKITGKK